MPVPCAQSMIDVGGSGYSSGGVNVYGNSDSIEAVKRWHHAFDSIPDFRREVINARNWAIMVDEVCSDYGPPEYRMSDDGEAWYWCFPGHDLPVADNLSELLVAGAQLTARKAMLKLSTDCL